METEVELPGRAGRIASFLAAAALTLLATALAGHLGAPGSTNLTVPGGDGLLIPAGGAVGLFLLLGVLAPVVTLLLPRGLGFLRAAAVIVTLGASARLLLLPMPASDDVDRYLWEGRVVAHGFSPYVHAPRANDDPELDSLRDPADPHWSGINHPRMTAIYPPLSLLVFAGAASAWYGPGSIKALVIAADLGTLLLLLLLLRDRRLAPRWALLYALNPAVLFAFAGESHNDAFQLLLLTAALLAFRRRRWGWMWLALGLAVQAKYVALLAWPLFLRRDNLRLAPIALVAAAGPVLALLPFDRGAMFNSLLAFGSEMAFNGPVQSALWALTGSGQLATRLCQVGFLVAYGAGLAALHPARSRASDPTGGLLFVFGALLVLSPTVHFWYLSWLAPLLALRPRASWLVLSATVGVTLVTYGLEAATGRWSFPAWGPWAVWTLPLLLLTAEAALGLRRLRARRQVDATPPRTMSVIIPTFEEAERIEGCLAAIWRSEEVVIEVIVADAGSSDATRSLAEAAGAVVVEHRCPFDDGGGRGGQIAAGLNRAEGDVVAIVHADTRVPPGVFDEVVAHLGANPGVIGGSIGAVFDGSGVPLRLVETANDLRAAFLGIAFGDQVQFYRRRGLDDGQFPALPLMEDIELSLRLRERGRTSFFFGSARVSPRRWRRGSPAGRAALVIRLTGEYLLRRLVGPPDTVAMYRRYYGEG